MATVLKREGGMVKTYHECPYCNDERASKEDKQVKPDREQHSWGASNGQDTALPDAASTGARCCQCGGLLTRNDLEDECEACHRAD